KGCQQALRRRDDPAAGCRQLRQRRSLALSDRPGWRLGMDDRLLEPLLEIAATVAGRNRILRLAVGIVGWAFDPNVEVVVVAVHGAHLVEPSAVALGVTTECLLDRRVDKNPLHFRRLSRGLDHFEMSGCPNLRIDVGPALSHDHGGRHVLALGAGEFAVRHGREPDIGMGPDLMAGMAREHRAAARPREAAGYESW